jgi:hypothetical protein
MAIGTRIEETEFVYGENLVSIEDTRGALHWLAEGIDPFEVLLIDDIGQQAEIHITDLVARPLTLWRLDADSLSQVEEYWEDWQQYGKKEVCFH